MHHAHADQRMSSCHEVAEAEVVQLADGARGEDVTAGLRSGEDATFDDGHVMTAGGEPRCRSTTSWTTSDDQDVGDGSGSGAGGSDDQGSASGA